MSYGNPDSAFGLTKGDRIELVQMGPDPDPIPAGTTGTVRGFFDDGQGGGQVWVDWDIDRHLNLSVPQDTWRKVDA